MEKTIEEMLDLERKEREKIPELVEISKALGVDILKIEKIPYRENLSTDKFQDIYYICDKTRDNTRLEVKIHNESIFSKYNLNFKRCSFERFSIVAKIDIKQLRFDDCSFGRVALDYCCCEKLEFWQCDIKLLLLRECKFLGDFILKSKYDFDNSDDNRTALLDDLNIIYTTFKSKCNFSGDIFKKLNLSHCVFEGNADFSGCEFGTEVDAAKTINLSSITFNGNAKFDESKFNHFVAFHTTSFEKTASFYKCEFNTIPNFSPADFKGILNINNVVWGEKNKGFDFKNVKELVEKAYNSNDTMENVINLRSSFSGMKHKLIEQDNLLDAQNFHKAELYCKEIELKKVKSRSTKEWVEWMLLLLYRKTSDHHTDLNRILHIMLMVIVSYGVMVLALEKILTCSCGVISSFLFASIWFVGAIAVLYPLYHIKEWRTGWLARGLLYAGTAAILLYQPQILNPVLGMSSSNEYKNTRVMKVIDKLTAAELNQVNTELIAWRHIQANIAKSTREQILENKNIIKKNKYLTPALPDIVTAIKQDEVIYATRQSMSVIYIVLLVLCLYSLQKTARKNTIVPS
nr:hypothetical protein [uncultured Campylobacter sp.]